MAHKHKAARGSKNFGVATGGGILAGLITGVILIFCLAAVAYRMSDPSAALMPLSLVALAVSAMVTGRVSCMLWDNRSLIPPLVSGTIYAILIAAGGLCIPGSTLTLWIRCVGCPAILALAMMGSLIGRRSVQKRHRH